MKSSLPRTLCALAVLAFAAQVTPAFADNLEDGREHFQRGVELHQEGDLKGALVEFRRANEISASFKIMYNIGQTEAELGNYLAAISALEQYLSSGGTQVPPERRTEVTDQLVVLHQRIGQLMVRANVDGAMLTIDGVATGRLPLTAPLSLNVGSHSVLLQDGARSQLRTVEIPGGELKSLDVAFPTIVPVAPPPKTVVKKSYVPMAISFGVAGAAAAGAVTFGLLAFTGNQHHQDELGRVHTQPYDADGAARTIKREAVVTDVLGGVGIVAAVVGVYFAIKPPKHTETTKVGFGPGSFVLTQQF